MKKSQNVKLDFIPGPAITGPFVAVATKDLSDEEAVDLADDILHKLAPLAAQFQKIDLEGARSEHAASEERKLVVEHGEDVCAAIQSALDTLSPLDDDIIDKLICPILCASELLIYPCWEYSETLAAREIVAYGRPVLEALAPDGDITRITLNKELLDDFRHLMRDDIFALRRTTAEYHVQKKIFELLHAYCEALVAKVTELGAHETAVIGLGLIHILDKREKSWRECLSKEDADAFGGGLMAFLRRFKNLQAGTKRQKEA